jgi:hypothetical protein
MTSFAGINKKPIPNSNTVKDGMTRGATLIHEKLVRFARYDHISGN